MYGLLCSGRPQILRSLMLPAPVMHALNRRTIGLVFLVCALAFEAALAASMNALGIPGVFLLELGETGSRIATTGSGGETVMAKGPGEDAAFPAVKPSANPAPIEAEPHPAAKLDVATLDPTALVASQAARTSETTNRRPVPTTAFIGGTASPETLPWDAIEPVPYSRQVPGAPQPLPSRFGPSEPAPVVSGEPAFDLSASAAGGWVKAKSTQFKGANRARPMFHFELWVEPPDAIKRRLIAVAYDVEAGAIQPRAQQSRERQTGFRVGFGGLSCADKITLTLLFDDGRSQEVDIDGCKLPG